MRTSVKSECKVSVIIPVYNTEKYIRRAVQSVCRQTFQDFEIILVDDGSSDSSWKVCESLNAWDNRIRIFHQGNAGAGAARNAGLREARGEYLFFLDSDDEWDERLMEKAVGCFEKRGCDCVRFQLKSTDEKLLAPQLPDDSEKLWSQKDFLMKIMTDNGYYVNASSCCVGGYKRTIIENAGLRFSENLAHGEDGKFVIEYLLNCREIVYLRDEFYKYYVSFESDDRVSATAREYKVLYDEYELCLLLFKKIYEAYKDTFTEEEKKKVYASFCDRMIGRLVRYAAYSDHLGWKEKRFKMGELTESALMKDAMAYYHPFRKTDSRSIPCFLRKGWIVPLWTALSMKKRRYYKIYGRKPCRVSIYRER